MSHLFFQNSKLFIAPRQPPECIPVGCLIACAGAQNTLHFPSEADLRISAHPPLHEFPGVVPDFLIVRLNHHTAQAGCMGCPVNTAVFLNGSRNQGEVPQSADFGSGNHQRIVGRIGCHTHRHFTAAEAADKIKDRWQTVVVVQTYILFEGGYPGFAVNQRSLRFFIVDFSAVLIDHGIQNGCIRNGNIRERNCNRQAVTLNGGKFSDQFLPGIRNLQVHFFHNICPVEQQREVLCLRQAVYADFRSVVVCQRVKDALVERFHYIFIIRKLRQILHRIAHRIVHGKPAADTQYDIGSVSGHNRCQDCICLNQFDVYLDTAFGGKRIVYHRLQNGALVAACGNPDVQHIIAGIVFVAQRVVIHEEGAHAAANLMGDTFKEVFVYGWNLRFFTRYHDQIHIQFAFGHVLHGGAQGSDIVLEVGKTFRNSVVVFNKLFQLDCQCEGGCGAVTLFPGCGNNIVNNLIQAFAFQIHGFNRFRINLHKIVIPESVRIRTGQDHQLPIDLVQAEDAVLNAFQHRAHLAERHFHADGMTSFGQIKPVRISVLIRQRAHFPARIVGEGHRFHFLKRHLIVDVHGTCGQRAALIHLPCFHGDVIISVFRYINIPLDPFTGVCPRISADIVQNCIGNGIRIRLGAGPVISGIKAGRTPQGRGFSLNLQGIVLSQIRHRDFRLTGNILIIIGILCGRRQCNSLNHHGFVHGLQREGILPFFEIEGIRLRLVSHIIPEKHGL